VLAGTGIENALAGIGAFVMAANELAGLAFQLMLYVVAAPVIAV
jgi:hypothetical protein